jgi:hypothetical protein
LAESQKQLQDLKLQGNKKEESELAKTIAAQKEELQRIKDAQAEARRAATVTAPAAPDPASATDSQKKSALAVTAPVAAAVAGTAAVASTRPVDEQAPVAPVAPVASRSIAQVSGAAAPASVEASSGGISLKTIELKGGGSQNEVRVNEIIEKQIAQYGVQPFVMNDPLYGQMEVTPAAGKDGRPVKDESGNYIYVKRRVIKNKTAKAPTPVKAVREPASQPSSDNKQQSYFYKNMNNEMQQALDKKHYSD